MTQICDNARHLPLRAALSPTRLSGKHCPEQDKGPAMPLEQSPSAWGDTVGKSLVAEAKGSGPVAQAGMGDWLARPRARSRGG